MSKRQIPLEFVQVEKSGDSIDLETERSRGGFNACDVVSVGKRRDGGTRYWCLAHRADATAKYGKPAAYCRYAHEKPIAPSEERDLDVRSFPGGVALWGAVPPVYDTTRLGLDRGIHVHARLIADEKEKEIDWTYRAVSLVGASAQPLRFTELDAIYCMVSSIFGFKMKEIECTYCGYSHLDKDWFAVHSHQRHLCSGCGKTFRDIEQGIGNPIEAARKALGHKTRIVPSRKKLKLSQSDFEGGLQLWGSNPAIVWTSQKVEEEGIHVHAFKGGTGDPEIDDTFGEVVIDGIRLNSLQLRTLMAQRALPHISGRISSIKCSSCKRSHFSSDVMAFTPATVHRCKYCRSEFPTVGRLRKVVSNPFIDVITHLSIAAVRPPQSHDLGLLPETI